MDAFEEEDAELFFGREKLVSDLVNRVKQSRAVFITGPSGSGKSSLVRVGLIHAVLRALRDGRFTSIYTTDLLVEIIDVLGRAKFRMKYQIESNDITVLINLIRLHGELLTPTQKVTICRDPKDEKFLEAALAGSADCIVSGDADLLDLTLFENISILRPTEFLARL